MRMLKTLVFWTSCAIIAGMVVTSFLGQTKTAWVLTAIGSVVVQYLLESLWSNPRRFAGWTLAFLALMVLGQSTYPIPEAVSPFEGWLGRRFGLGEYGQLGVEVLVIVALVVASFLLLRRKRGDWPEEPEEEWPEPPDDWLAEHEINREEPFAVDEEPVAGPRDVDLNDGDDYPRSLDEDLPLKYDDPRWDEDGEKKNLKIDVIVPPASGRARRDRITDEHD
jgi:hypothetical protein